MRELFENQFSKTTNLLRAQLADLVAPTCDLISPLLLYLLYSCLMGGGGCSRDDSLWLLHVLQLLQLLSSSSSEGGGERSSFVRCIPVLELINTE